MRKTNTPKLHIQCRSINAQPNLTFSTLYNELQRREALKTEYGKTIAPSSRNFNRRYYATLTKKYKPQFDPDQFNITKRIKEIQRFTKAKKLDPLQSDSRIAYAKDKIDIVFESTKLLKSIQLRKNSSLSNEVEPLNTFITDSKEISVNNVLINLLKTESGRLENKEQNVLKAFKEENENFKRDQNNFEEYSETQKQACKEIEQVLSDITKKNRELLYKEKTYLSESRQIREEMEKVLEQIDSGRICAKFVNHVLGGNTSRFNKEIIPARPRKKRKDDDDELNVNYEEITAKVINDYGFILNDDFTKESEKLLRDPVLMLLRYKEFEDRIIRMINIKNKLDEEIRSLEKEHKVVLDELKEGETSNKLELESMNNDFNKLLNDIRKKSNEQEYRSKEYDEFVKDLNKTIIDENINYNKSINNVKPIIMKKNTIVDIACETVSIINDLETLINDYLTELDIYMKQDKQTFIQSIIIRRNQNKQNKQLTVKLKLEEEINDKRVKAQERMDRIIIQSRKMHIPMKFIKKKKKVTLNKSDAHNERDWEMLEY